MLNEKGSKVSNNHGEVHFNRKQRLTVTPSENTLPNRIQSRKDAEDACDQHAILQKLNSPTTSTRNLNNCCNK